MPIRGQPDTPLVPASRAWLAILLLSLLGSAWLLATKTMGPWVIDLVGNWYFLFNLLAIPAFMAGLLAAFALLVSIPAERRRLAALPVLLNALALAMFLLAPYSRPLDLLDFQRHYAVRAEVVRRVEAGELWSGSPLTDVVSVPREYPTSVSDSDGQRGILVGVASQLNLTEGHSLPHKGTLPKGVPVLASQTPKQPRFWCILAGSHPDLSTYPEPPQLVQLGIDPSSK